MFLGIDLGTSEVEVVLTDSDPDPAAAESAVAPSMAALRDRCA